MSSRAPRIGHPVPLAPLQSLLAGRRRRRPLISPHVLGLKSAHRLSRAKLAKLTEQDLREMEIGRAYLCGARYSCWGWNRREPPRFRDGRRRNAAEFALLLECGRAFYRGYDAATRARYARDRAWDVHQLGRGADG